MFYYVYILFSKRDKKLYIGYCQNLRVRIKRHNNGFVRATKNRRPLTLIYYEGYKKESDAKRREKYLKGGQGRNELKQQLRDVFEDIDYAYK